MTVTLCRQRLALWISVLCIAGCQSKPPKKPGPAVPKTAEQIAPEVTPQKRLGQYEGEASKLDARMARMAQDAASRYVTPFNKTVYEAGMKLLSEKKYFEARRRFDEAIRLAVEKGAKGGEPIPLEEGARPKPLLPQQVERRDYRISTGDVLEVVVWGAPDLSGEVQVRPDGKVSYQYVGEVEAAGMTFDELGACIRKKLQEHIQKRAAPVRGEYRICAGDVLSVGVEGAPEMATDIQVAPDGRIWFAYAGEIMAQGMTFRELSDLLTEKLAKYIKKPQAIVNAKQLVGKAAEGLARYNEIVNVTIQAKGLVGNTAMVMGAVEKPGQVQVGRDTRLLDVLAQAGGVTKQYRTEGVFEAANLRDAYLVRNHSRIPVDFQQLLVEGDTTQNVPILPGDLVYVPTTREKEELTVTVLGALRNPGRIRLMPDMRVLDGIAEAGGLFIGSVDIVQLQAAALNKAFLSRDGVIMPVDFEQLMLEGDLSQNILLQAGDFIYVPTSEDNLIFVLGEVNLPRSIPYGTKMTFARALASAGGLTLSGSRGAVYLVRGDLKKKPTVTRVDAFAVLEGRHNDIRLEPYDIVYVSPTALTETSHIITQIIPGLSSALDVKVLRHGQ